MGDVLKAAYLRASAVDYIKRFIGLPYIWGGDDPLAGFDCSGLIIEVLQAVGLLANGSDYTAAQLYEKFEAGALPNHGYAGCLVFWYYGEAIIHVEMMIDDLHTVGASGGGSKTKSIADAIKNNAFVKQRPLFYRGDKFLIVDPFKVEDE
jgi:cell wall-associated NlpC family hydrolase